MQLRDLLPGVIVVILDFLLVGDQGERTDARKKNERAAFRAFTMVSPSFLAMTLQLDMLEKYANILAAPIYWKCDTWKTTMEIVAHPLCSVRHGSRHRVHKRTGFWIRTTYRMNVLHGPAAKFSDMAILNWSHKDGKVDGVVSYSDDVVRQVEVLFRDGFPCGPGYYQSETMHLDFTCWSADSLPYCVWGIGLLRSIC